MRQIWISRAGAPEVLELREAPDPEPGPGEVRVRVAASGINFADLTARMGIYPDMPPIPCVVGYEVSGVVDGRGEGVDDLEDGAKVVALTRFGGYSDVVCIPRAQVVRIPEGISMSAAAAVPVNYLTAWLMLVELGNVRADHTVLVHAAAGGVGQAALQICKWRGATVIGTASAGKHERLREVGIDHCIDYRTQDFEPEVMRITDKLGVDIVLDAVGGESYAKSYRCLRHCGRLFMFGASSFAPSEKRRLLPILKGLMKTPKFKPFELLDLNRGVHGVNLGHLWHEIDRLEVLFEAVMAKIGDQTLVPVIDREFGFDEAAAAHAYIQGRNNFGKVLLVA
ncbi:Phthiocerol synthesis polyketide synthase type I PpsC [Enhygromyxa salina]|uniref:Phthiocerol synthesis polyketide synthase type I PpsC n=1 Tax=Enhygromyxa salina TaxID=215803 RepID=A0A2S9XG23_9BACT|nr:zinc-binding dehydrogenase [Enhygromyxa salina]PRP91828.1 Phthiocerol synthesis polyketide synthase type I PpsC [Enhygromyxa salina]